MGDLDSLIEHYTQERYLTRNQILFRLDNRYKSNFNIIWEEILRFRKARGLSLSLTDQFKHNFWFVIPPFVEKKIHDINFVAKHKLEEIASKELYKKILIEDMLLEEAFYSSVIEGAFTTKKKSQGSN